MKKLIVALSVILVMLVIEVFPCYAQGSVIYGCANKKNGDLRIVNNAGQCKPGENPINWNQTGDQGPPGPGLIWQEVTGTSQQALPNIGYIANNDAQVTIILPASPAIGDVIRVSGAGAGGWKVAQNAGQFIITLDIGAPPGYLWTPRESNRYWASIASSSDGSKLVAVVDGGQIYTSTDSGVTWTPRETNRRWYSVASSSDGSRLVAGVLGGQIYTSTDSGVTWTPQETNRNWYSVASSSDGNKLVAVVYGGQIYTSTDSGVTWTPRESWRQWQSVASSSDGSKLVATVQNDEIFTSPDSGVTWIPRLSSNIGGKVASSSDGSKLVATNWQSGVIYTSVDYGAAWTLRASGKSFWPVASSSDGSKLVVGVREGQIYTLTELFTTTPGPSGYLAGYPGTAIELQYIGNNQFLPLSFVGTFDVY